VNHLKFPNIRKKNKAISNTALSVLLQRIEINSKILDGKPFFKGTKITVEEVLKLKDKGLSSGEILKIYPTLTQEDIQAVSLFR